MEEETINNQRERTFLSTRGPQPAPDTGGVWLPPITSRSTDQTFRIQMERTRAVAVCSDQIYYNSPTRGQAGCQTSLLGIKSNLEQEQQPSLCREAKESKSLIYFTLISLLEDQGGAKYREEAHK